MKKYLSVLLVFQAFITWGQTPVLSRAHFYMPGDSFLRISKIDTGINAITVDSGGANVTWDFSAVDFEHPSVMVDTITCLLPDSTPFFNYPGVNYDTSNLCLRIDTDPFSPEDDNFIYYRADNNAVQFAGSWANNGGSERAEYQFANLRTELMFSFTFNQSFTDSFVSSYNDNSGSGMHFQQGVITVTADGYGTLVTPDGATLENALRLKEEVTYTDSSVFFGTASYYTLTYYWYATNVTGPVLQLSMDVSAPGVIMNAYYFKHLNPVATGIEKRFSSTVSVYPNPATHQFIISIGDHQPARTYTLRLLNATGKLLRKENLATSTITVNAANLSPGIYFAEISDENGYRTSKKIIVY